MIDHTQIIRFFTIIACVAPLAGTLIAGFMGQWLGRRVSQFVTILLVALSLLASCVIFQYIVILNGKPLPIHLFAWAITGDYQFNVSFLVDHLTAVMMVMVTFISLLVHIYSVGYMAYDKDDQRFFSYMSAFTFAMLILVLANNFFLLFLGWEGVGLISYLLIGYWFQKEAAAFGSLKAFLVNRVADIAFLLAIALIFSYTNGHLSYKATFASISHLRSQTMSLWPGNHIHVITLITLLLTIGAMGKSAQMPFHVWLPESMEGPTPISALIHAATMVTAGIYIIARLSFLFQYAPTTLSFILVIGATTCLFCGILALFCFDIKRVIAYSTLSQLGYMMLGCGASCYSLALFHLLTHACFKALLFLAAGSVITALHHEQDMRKMGGLAKYMPITYATALIGSLALVAIPPFAGFYSKDSIIEFVRQSTLKGSHYGYICATLGAMITACYTFRLLFMVFHGKESDNINHKRVIKESHASMTIPLILLSIPSITLGMILTPWIIDSHHLFGQAIYEHHLYQSIISHSIIKMTVKETLQAPFFFALVGIVVAWYVTLGFKSHGTSLKKRLSWLYYIVWHKYGFDDFNQIVIVGTTQKIAHFCSKKIDNWVIDSLLVNGCCKTIQLLSKTLRLLQSGYLYHYIFMMMGGVFILCLFYLI